MKLLASADEHFDEHSPRWEECLRVHGWIAEQAEALRPDVFLCGGDIYERASTPREREAAAEWLTRIADVCPVIVTKGNHDRHLDCAILARLRAKHWIKVVEAAEVIYWKGAAFACVAWPDKSALSAAALRLGEDVDALADHALRNVLTHLGTEMAACDGPRIALGHFMVDGSVTSVGQPMVGQDLHVGLADLGLLNAHLTIMGHIHKPQEWSHNGAPILYTGSPFRTTYGETEDKSIVYAELAADRLVELRRIKTPCAGMWLVEDEWTAGGGWLSGETDAYRRIVSPVDDNDFQGADLRFRYAVAPDQRDAARAAAARWRDCWLELGFSCVKIEEEVQTSTRARAPEVAAALTLSDKLQAYWKARGTEPEPPRAARLIRMAESIEREGA